MIAIIDYGMGNLKNVYKALISIGVEAVITSEIEVIKACDKVILPGVGAFKEAIATLHRTGLKEIIEESVTSGKPLLGICLGMQLLFETSYENGRYEGLGLLPGEIIKLDVPFKVPHMGWNRLEIVKEAPIFEGISNGAYTYFVHSYHMEGPEEIISAYTTYGKKIGIGVQKDNIYGLQFHPEKSGEVGVKMLKNFASL